MRAAGWCGAIIAVAFAVTACTAEAPGGGGDATHESGIARAMPDSVVAVQAVPPEPPYLRTIVGVTVVGFTGPGGKPFEVNSRTSRSDAALHRQIGMRNFALPLRLSATTLTQYPCATCHQGATVTARRDQAGHDNIKPQHPSHAEGVCTTCHVSGAVDRLALAGGATTTLDHPYRLCGQCHYAQVNAWAAGAHGKRLVAWGGRRVVMSCTDCHDPHRPGTDLRLPFPGPRIRRAPGVAP